MASAPEATAPANGRESDAAQRGDSVIELRLTHDEARVLSEVANRGMLAGAGAGSPPVGNPAHAKAALDKLEAGISEADRVRSLRAELEQAGLATSHLGDMQVTTLARRVAELADGPR